MKKLYNMGRRIVQMDCNGDMTGLVLQSVTSVYYKIINVDSKSFKDAKHY